MRTEIQEAAKRICKTPMSQSEMEAVINEAFDQCLATNNEIARQRRERLYGQITFWQGKFSMVKHELSIVRNRLYKREQRT